jgi:two-component system chemotaxis response regulator CheB
MNRDGVVRNVIAIGASAEGVEALIEILRRLPPELPAVIGIAIHRSPVFGSALVRVLARVSPLPLSEPEDLELIQPGRVYLAPRDRHLMLDGDCWRLSRGPQMHRMRPAVDPLFESAAKSHAQRVAGVLLSGGGSDGVSGLTVIKARGGLSIVQRPEEARHPSMPIHAIRGDDVDAILSLEEIAAAIPVLAAGGETPSGAASR